MPKGENITDQPSGDQRVVFIDADDTLWENNRWFTRVIEEWVAFVVDLGADGEAALFILHEEEDRNIPVHGYGARPFVHSLRTAFTRVLGEPTDATRTAFEGFVQRAELMIREHPIDLLPGVYDGVTAMADAGLRLVLLTKGQQDEQTAKFARSTLTHLFESVRVVNEKDVATYRAAAHAVGASPENCWMVGNSPRSDINPAREIGMRTVHVPHAAPWHRELAPLVNVGPATIVVATFADVPHAILQARPQRDRGPLLG